MIFIPIGTQCHVADSLKRAGLRVSSYPFDYIFSPSKSTYNIFYILINVGVDAAIEYMTTGYSYYKAIGNEHFVETDEITTVLLNKNTGVGIVHDDINDEYKAKLKRRFTRLLTLILTNEQLCLCYADSNGRDYVYRIDGEDYTLDATDDLLALHDLLYHHNPNIDIYYFAWPERKRDNDIIKYVDFERNFDIGSYLRNKYSNI
jgi:hypothetical protein